MQRIEGESFSVSIAEKGAELLSFHSKKDGREYIWKGDPSVWKWHAPVLFPQCGNFPDGYSFEGKTRILPMHGFLRDKEHSYLGKGRFLFSFSGTEDYPFSFDAYTTFLLEGNKLLHRVEIKNTSSLPLPCSLGFHTGYSISSPMITFEKEENEIGGRFFKCSDDTLFKTKLFTKISSRTFLLEGEEGKRIRISSPDFSTLVIWSPSGHSKNLVCIEPRFDTVPYGAKEPFGKTIEAGESVFLEEKIEILE